MIIIKVDIIGGGLGGLSTAITLKEQNKNIEVTVHEKHKTIGYNHEGRKCGEAHTMDPEWDKWKPDKTCIFNEIKKGEVIIGKKTHVIYGKPGAACILNRQKFISHLGKKAAELSVSIQTNDKIKTINDLEGDYIVDASGCPSTIKKELGLIRGIMGYTYQQTLEDSNAFNSDTIKIVFLGELGYYWVFPRDKSKNEINLGVGFIKERYPNLKNILEEIKKEQNIKGKINYVAGGMIPLGLQRPLMHDNILFVGDTGVGAFPLNGEGIYRALLSGEIAGRCLAVKKPKKYPYLINKAFIKWDIIGKTHINLSLILKPINPKLVLANYNIFSSLVKERII